MDKRCCKQFDRIFVEESFENLQEFLVLTMLNWWLALTVGKTIQFITSIFYDKKFLPIKFTFHGQNTFCSRILALKSKSTFDH